MRKTSAALASLSLIALALTGCAAAPSFEGQSCDRTSSGDAIEGSVQVSGDFGVSPDVEVFAPVVLKQSSFTDVIEGDGVPLTSPNQVFTLDYALYDGISGAQIQQTEFDGDATPRPTNITTFGQSLPGIAQALQCATPGTRVVAGLSPEDTGAKGPVIVVVDVLDTKLARATGALQFNDAQGMPTVVRAPDGRPGIIVPDADAPTEQVVQVLIKGDGPVVEEGDHPWVNYTQVDWDSHEQLSSTWGANPTGDLATAAPHVAAALVGQPIGSQVMVVLPAKDDTAASVYVVDILGAGSAPAQ